MPLLRCLFLVCAVATAADWPQFRGPNGSGVSDSTRLPSRIGPSSNLIWRTALPPGHSSPALTETRIFVTAAEREQIVTICLDREKGKILWKREAPRPRKEYMQDTNTPASPSPATDGSNVYVFFGDFGMISYSPDGEERWRLPMGPFNNANGHGSSPIVSGKLVVLICDQDTNSFLVAVDKDSGKVKWVTPRPDSTRGYATPAVYQPKDGPAELIVPGAYRVVSYLLATGEPLWWVRGFAWQLKSVPLIDGDVIYVSGWETGGDATEPPNVPTFAETLAKFDTDHDGKISRAEIGWKSAQQFAETDLNHDGVLDERDWNFYRARKTSQNNTVAIRAGGKGDVTDTHVLWRFRKPVPNVPSPLLYNGVIFLMKEGGILTTLDPKTGEVLKQGRLTGALGQYWSSPVGADGKVYVASQEGQVTVLKAAGKWDILEINELGEEIFATPAIVDGRIYLRTRAALYCFGRK
ncbi:MAG TPA: PQQ-binding-like beta-propeller repeat protein [Bryobacteraceae bacterium]|nr:PQQ-binding-like beta-propeller repeat protein [Bryobacteraceae bacterium]